MCGLFGYTCYGEVPGKISKLTQSLAEEAAVRGTDATGIAYVKSGKVKIFKQAKAASDIKFNHANNIRAIIGHTRHSTQGSEKRNFNNHPFYGKCKNTNFAFAHNGVLMNDSILQMRYNFPKTHIETDSYVGVQLLEYKKKLNAESLKFMAEEVEGSFSFSILDDKNNLYLVKGDSPLSILHFPELRMYIYASTDEILYKGIVDSPLFDELIQKRYEKIPIEEGQILKITSSGLLEYSRFNYTYSYSMRWWDYGFCFNGEKEENEYIRDLKSVAVYQGYEPETIDELLENGFCLEEIEDYIYGM